MDAIFGLSAKRYIKVSLSLFDDPLYFVDLCNTTLFASFKLSNLEQPYTVTL